MVTKIFSMLMVLITFAHKVHGSDVETLASWIAIDAPTGHEHLAANSLVKELKGWTVDRNGNVLKTIGTGSPHRVVACAMDAPSFAVSQITDEGYLRLHHIGRSSQHPLWSQFHEGQQLRILTRSGPVIGISAIANGHFSNLHKDETNIIRADDLWVDVGASTAQEAKDMGIALLDPVLRHIPAWFYSDEAAGPNAGARVGCAVAVAGAEAGISGNGATTWILTSQSAFRWVGLSSALASLNKVDELILLDKGQSESRNEDVTGIHDDIDKILKATGVSKIQVLAPKVMDPGALMERIKLAEAENLLNTVTSLVDTAAPKPVWVKAPSTVNPLNNQIDSLPNDKESVQVSGIEKLLDPFAEMSAVSGHEGPIRAMVRSQMPAWAKKIAQTDDIGNIWLDMGPKNGTATVFIAHMDEVGWEIKAIDEQGIVRLKKLGGVVTTAWEGQPALLQLDKGTGAQSAATAKQMKGVYLSRNNPTTRHPDGVNAWFGMDGASLKSAGVTVGMAMTGYKEGHRIGRYRYSSRGLDDRIGVTALLAVLKDFNPEKLDHSVIFAWSTQEEVGLFGAKVLAERYGRETNRVYSIDTFVSSDTPLEQPHFAYTPLGNGPVLRSIENSSMVRPDELDRNRSILNKSGIPYQVGLTQGGTDGTAFTFWGAPNAGLSWPGRYSHSPAEVADLRDVVGLVKLIRALALAKP